MKVFAFILASLLLVGSLSEAQMGGMGGMGGGQPLPALAPEDKVALELLELEQDVDKALLKEALTTLGKEAMISPSVKAGLPEEALKRRKSDLTSLEEFVKGKKAAILSRSSEMALIQEKPVKARREKMLANQAKLAPKPDRLAQIETMELAQAEVQLLSKQVQLYQDSLTTSINELANAEFMAAKGGVVEKEGFEAAKKTYDKIKTKYVEFSKQLQIEQGKAMELQQQLGMSGMGGGGMGGMGGGMR